MNSIGNAYSSTDAESFTSKLIARYRSLVEKIYRDGGRKFLFLNVPAVSRTPKILSQGNEAAKSHVKYLAVFNQNVESMVKNFTSSHKDVRAPAVSRGKKQADETNTDNHCAL